MRWWLLLGVGAVAILARVIALDKGVSGDETLLVQTITKPWAQIPGEAIRGDVYPPLPYLVVGAWSRVLPGEIGMRLYFVLIGLGLVALLGRWASQLNAQAGWMALSLGACSPLLVWASQYLRPYGDAAFWMAGSLWCGWLLLSGRHRLGVVVGYTVTTLLALGFSYYNWLIVGCQWTYLWMRRRDLPPRLGWIIAGLAGIMLMWFPWMVRQWQNATGVTAAWQYYGWHMGPLHLGGVVRGLAAIGGFDPYLAQYRVTALVSPTMLALGGVALLVGLISVLWLVSRQLPHTPLAIRQCLSYLAWVGGWSFAGFILLESLAHVTMRPKYLVLLHGLALIGLALWLASQKRWLTWGALATLLVIYAARLPAVYGAEYEFLRAKAIVEADWRDGDGLLYVKEQPWTPARLQAIDAFPALSLDYAAGQVRLLAEGEETLAAQVVGYQRLWFVRQAGDLDLFGANRAVEACLERQGFRRGSVARFRNVMVEEWVSRDEVGKSP